MSDNNYRVEWADGTSTEVSFRLLPLVQIEVEEHFDGAWLELLSDPKRERDVFSFALWRWFQLRQGETREYHEWLATVDAFFPIGQLAEMLAEVAKQREAAAPLDRSSDSSSESAEPQTDPVSPFTS